MMAAGPKRPEWLPKDQHGPQSENGIPKGKQGLKKQQNGFQEVKIASEMPKMMSKKADLASRGKDGCQKANVVFKRLKLDPKFKNHSHGFYLQRATLEPLGMTASLNPEPGV